MVDKYNRDKIDKRSQVKGRQRLLKIAMSDLEKSLVEFSLARMVWRGY